MNDSELPEAAISDALVDAGAKAAYLGMLDTGFSLHEVARAVLVAATERIECPKCEGKGGRDLPCPVDASGASLTVATRMMCSACAGSGVLFVLKTEKP